MYLYIYNSFYNYDSVGRADCNANSNSQWGTFWIPTGKCNQYSTAVDDDISGASFVSYTCGKIKTLLDYERLSLHLVAFMIVHTTYCRYQRE